MTNIGWSLKLTSMWHRALASYLRAVAGIMTTLLIGGAVTDKIDLSVLASLGWAMIGALVPPVVVFITEAANLLDGNQPPP